MNQNILRNSVQKLVALGVSQNAIGRRSGIRSSQMVTILRDDSYQMTEKTKQRLLGGLNSYYVEMENILKENVSFKNEL